MNSLHRALIAIGCVALFIARTSGAQTEQLGEQTFTPARLPDDFESTANELALPGYHESTNFYLYCVTDVRLSGRVRNTTCLNDETYNLSEFQELIVKLMKRTRMSPAMVNREAEATEFYFRVHIDYQHNTDRIKVYPNWGYDAEEHGMMYEAPQRYDTRIFPKDCYFFVGIAKTPIDANGRVSGETVLTTPLLPEKPTLDCIEKIKARLINGKFIPAHNDGEPVAAIQFEVWGNPDDYILDLPVQN